MNIPCPLFEPDRNPFLLQTSDNLKNVLPVADGVGPLPSLIVYSEALPSECRGSVSVIDDSDVIHIYAGTATNLYKLNTSTSPYSWDEVSKSTDAYAVPAGDFWQFAVFGDRLIAVQLGNSPQYIDVSSGTLFADLPNAPTARYVWTAGDFVFLGYLSTSSTSVQWSGLNDSESWTPGEKFGDIQVIPSGGIIMGGLGDQRGSIIAQKNAFGFLNYAPSSGWTFTRSEANTVRGVIAPYSIQKIGTNQFFYLSEDGFFAGIEGQAIGGERVDDWFRNMLDYNYLNEVQSMTDPLQKIAWWRFRNTEGNRILIGYNWQLDRWCYSDQDLTQAARIATPALTIDGLGVLYSTIDEINILFDSRIFKGGRPIFAGFNSDNKLVFQAGGAEAATIVYGDGEFSDTSRSFVNGGRLETNAETFTVTHSVADYHGGDFTAKATVSPSSRSRQLPFRGDGRLHRFQVNILAGESWSHVGKMKLSVAASGSL